MIEGLLLWFVTLAVFILFPCTFIGLPILIILMAWITIERD